jgi:hypothetical protein
MYSLINSRKLKINMIYFLLVFSFVACSDDDVKVIGGTLEYDASGEYIFSIDAKNITAKITIIGAGGGGAGGASDNSGSSLPGGGGGGAGEVVILNNVDLLKNVNYVAFIGIKGIGGTKNSSGSNGQKSSIKLENNILFSAIAGKAGGIDSQSSTGGIGGKGFPEGGKGQDSQGNGTGGNGGVAGDNQSGYGQGGTGGQGEGNSNQASNGTDGQSGYIKIEWTGSN